MEDRGSSAISTDEQVVRGANGWMMLAVLLVALALAVPLAVVEWRALCTAMAQSVLASVSSALA